MIVLEPTAEDGNADELTVKQMQEYLKERGVTVEDKHRDSVVQLYNVVFPLNLPKDPDFTKEQGEVKEKIARQLHELTGKYLMA